MSLGANTSPLNLLPESGRAAMLSTLCAAQKPSLDTSIELYADSKACCQSFKMPLPAGDAAAEAHIADVCAQALLAVHAKLRPSFIACTSLAWATLLALSRPDGMCAPSCTAHQRHPGMFRRDEPSCLQETRLALHVSLMYELGGRVLEV